MNGWHHEHIYGRSARSGTMRHWDVTFRTQRHRCCGQTWAVWNDKHSPVLLDGTDAEPVDRVSQCRSCGSLQAPHWTARERVE